MANYEKRTVVDSQGKKRTVTVNTDRRFTVTGKGAVVYKTIRSKTPEGRTLIKGKSQQQILDEAREKEAGIKAIEDRRAREKEQQAKKQAEFKAGKKQKLQELTATRIKQQYEQTNFKPVLDGGVNQGSISRTEINRIDNKKSPVASPVKNKKETWAERYARTRKESSIVGKVEKAEEPQLSEKLFRKALDKDAERTLKTSFEASAITTGAVGVGIAEVLKNVITDNEKDLKRSGVTLKNIVFPEIDKGTIYQRSGSTIVGFGVQEAGANLIVRGIIKGVNIAKDVFGTKTIISKSKGTGETISFIDEPITQTGQVENQIRITEGSYGARITGINQNVGTNLKDAGAGRFEQFRTIIQPIDEAKKSNILLQKISTESKDIPFSNLKNIGQVDILKVTNKYSVKNKATNRLFTPERVGQTRSTITTYDLKGNIIGGSSQIDSVGFKLPNTKNTVRIVKTIEQGETKITYALTKSDQFVSMEKGNIPKSLTVETTKGAGKKQTVFFKEDFVTVVDGQRKSIGSLANKLEDVNLIPKTPSTPKPSVGQMPKLPVTLQAGTKPLRIKIPNMNLRGLPSITSTTAFNPERDTKQPRSQTPILLPDNKVDVDMGKAVRKKEIQRLEPTEYVIRAQESTKKQSQKQRTTTTSAIVPAPTITTPQTQPVTGTVPSSPKHPKLRTPKTPIIPKLPILPGFKGAGSKRLNAGSFQAQVKVKGKWLTIGKGLPKSKAIDLSKSFVKRRSSASFRVLGKGGIPLTNIGLGSMFRKSKKDKGVFIEKEKFRLDFPTELSEITFSPKQRRRKKRGRKK